MEKKENTVVQTKEERKPVLNISDSVLVQVQSCFCGKLVYRKYKSGDTICWNEMGEIQVMSMRDLREMKSEQVGFFQNQWIIVLGVAPGEKCKATPEDIYKALIVSQYYTNFINPADFEDVCHWSDSEIERRVSMLSDGAKSNLAVAISGYIQNGQLDSIKKIKAFSKALDCDFRDNY